MGVASSGFAPRRQALPPLPDRVSATPQGRAGGGPSLMDGSYLINYVPSATFGLAYEGTLRVETTTGRIIASGDFYQRLFDDQAEGFVPSPDPKSGIPIFPIKRYRYYLRVTDLLAADGGFVLTF